MATTDFSVIATKIAAVKPDVVVVAMADANAASLIVQCREAGVEATSFFGNNATASPSFIRVGGAAVNGVFLVADAFVQGRIDPFATKFAADYRQRFKAEPSQWADLGYTLITVLARAIADVKGPLTREAIRDGIGRVHDLGSVLGTGSFTFRPDREPSYQPLILTVRNGAFQLAP